MKVYKITANEQGLALLGNQHSVKPTTEAKYILKFVYISDSKIINVEPKPKLIANCSYSFNVLPQ